MLVPGREMQMEECIAAWDSLGWNSHRRSIAAVACACGRTEEQLLAVLKRDFARVAPIAAIARVPTGNGDLISLLDGHVFFPSGAIQDVGRKSFQLPVDHFSGGVFDVQVEEAMGIGP